MYLFTITLLTTNLVISHASFYKKCCKIGEYLTEIDSSYVCVDDKRKRLEILSNETDFLNASSDGECAEVTTDFFIFTVNNGTVESKRPASGDYFPKCCPINYTYNTVFRSCQKNDNSPGRYIKENFIKVGLPNCKVIVDNELNNSIDLEYDLINATSLLNITTVPYPGSYCIDENEKGTYVYRECKENVEVCQDMRCIKKCCPDGQSFIGGARCVDTYVHGLNLSAFPSVDDPEDPYAIVHNRSCSSIFIMKEEKHIFRLDNKGGLHLWSNYTESMRYFDVGNFKSYCIEYTKKKTLEGYYFFMCFFDTANYERFVYTLWPKVMSCICLMLTIAIYLILNEGKKVFGKILINYCIALLLENFILAYAQVFARINQLDCQIRSFSIIFFATATFSWSNVICCDIWWTFGSATQTVGAQQRKRDFKKLLWYFLYGWGVPTIVTLVILIFYSRRVLPYSIHPFMAEAKCFFERKQGNYSHAIFFNFPHSIIQLVNVVLFIKTIVYCLKVKDEINKINDTSKADKSKKFERDKERLFLIIKLSVIMGVSFIFEVVSAFFFMSEMGPVWKYTEIVWDTINCLQGVFIFIIFICKRKILHIFFLKFKLLHRKNLSSSSMHTQSTTTSNGTSMKVINSSNENGNTSPQIMPD